MRIETRLFFASLICMVAALPARAQVVESTGAVVVLGPAGDLGLGATLSTPQFNKGIFFTALRDFQLANVSIDMQVTDSLDVSLYAASRTNRGARLARVLTYSSSIPG